MRVAILLLLTSSCYGLSFPPSLFGWPQSVGVQGKVKCNGEPLPRFGLLLYDVGYSEDLMSASVADDSGSFRFTGSGFGYFRLRPKLDILHTYSLLSAHEQVGIFASVMTWLAQQ
ncbi:hypothetical protein Y032_0134g1875 [Ancylostoma ceylanicum]|uniref:Transthyretin-like family protein n=1 Tax=Ancylostoma ceylanicum TaxID=53326 RepID=A0A016T5Z0_9BILA|nr:hypothetical protein Y032_0134g1875 [Ancylostoma ceylanicum]